MSAPQAGVLPRVRSRAASLRRAVGRVLDRSRTQHPAETESYTGALGMVELFSRNAVKGWVSVPADSPPTRVTLYLDDLAITSTYAAPEEPGTADAGVTATPGPVPGPAQHLPSPGEEQRNTGQQVRWFRFRLDDMWQFCDTSTRVSVRVDDAWLPIAGHGTFLLPDREGGQSLRELRRKVRDGHVFSQKGRLQASKQHDVEWQGSVIRLYQRTDEILRAEHGYDAFFVYGTLLGAIREGTYIGHDVDFDAAYVSSRTHPARVSQELVQIALTLIEHGLAVTCLPTHLHVSDPDEPDLHIDLFHTYFDADGVLRFPFGVAGTSVVHQEDWQGVREIAWPGGHGSVPVNAEQVVECLYGADWRQPKPGFHWPRDRTGSARGKLTRAQRSKVYWTNFYAHTSYTSGSTFFELLDSRPDTPTTVIDIGCGDGRDSCAFGTAGRQVLGLDQSPIGVEHAAARARTLGLQETTRFTVCDVAESETLTAIVAEVLAAADGPVLFYLRFFLHAIPEGLQDSLIEVISTCARPGDVLAAEFRTEEDESASKVHGQHYRRFQNGPAFGDLLRERGFTVQHEEEGTGLSPYQGEDPVLYRVIARRLPCDAG